MHWKKSIKKSSSDQAGSPGKSAGRKSANLSDHLTVPISFIKTGSISKEEAFDKLSMLKRQYPDVF